MDQQPAEGQAPEIKQGTYTHGYGRSTVQHMGERTADREGQFFARHLRAGMRVLDVGCGPGTITLGFARVVAPGEVVGVDREPTMIEQAAALAAERGVHNVRFELGNAEELPFPDATFDAAFENTLLEHVAGPRRVVDEMCRVLKPGGIIGLRDGDLGGQLIYPSNRIVEEVWTLYDRLWRHNGGNPEQGRLQRGLLRTAGFGELQTSAGATINFAPAYLRVLTDPHFVDRVIALGWAKPAMIERYTQALGEWAANPDAFGAAVAIETVGWKV